MNGRFTRTLDHVGGAGLCLFVVAVLCLVKIKLAWDASRVRAVVARARSLRGRAGLESSDAASVEKPEGNPGGADRSAAGEDPSRRARRLGIDELLRDESQFEADDDAPLFI